MKTENDEKYGNESTFTGYSGIARKLVLIMGECSHVAKDGFNDYHKYKYASAAGVLEAINAALVKHKVASVVTPAILSNFDVTNAKGNVEHQVTVGCNIMLIDSESGESIDLYGIGTGQDAGDKAVMKAQTAAIKYAFMLSLCIATGDDPEADSAMDERNYEEPQYQQPQQYHRQALRKSNQPAANGESGTDSDAGAVCVACGREISPKVLQYSLARYKRPLCMDCQKKEHYAA